MEVGQAVDPLDALAAQHGATPAAAAPTVDPLDALAASHGAQLPTFHSENAKDAAGNPIVSGAGHVWDALNTPLVPQIAEAAHAIAKHLDQPALDRSKLNAQIRGFFAGATEGAGDVLASFTSPVGIALTLASLGPEGSIARRLPFLKGLLELPQVKALQTAAQKGFGAAFAVHGADKAVEAPTWGGKAAGVAEAAGGLAGVLPGRVRVGAPFPNPNPVEVAAIERAGQAGVPIDAATATGNKLVSSLEAVSAHAPGGTLVARPFRQAQDAALDQWGRRVADDVHPTFASPEQAGDTIAGPDGAMRSYMRDAERRATAAYDKLRAFEQDPKFGSWVSTAPVGSRSYNAILSKLAAGLEDGQAPTLGELRGMRQIEVELDAQPFTKFLLRNPEKGKGATTLEHVEGTGGAGAPVYHEILQAAPGTASMTRKEVLQGIRRTLEEGEWTNAGRGALDVARQRLRQGKTGGPNLPTDAPILGTSERIGLPVDLRQAKQLLTPLYEQLMREKDIVPPMGDKARALLALHRLMGGPDIAPASVVDGALGELKSFTRVDVPELRTQGQGAIAQAIKAIEPALQNAVGKAGREATLALEEGRGETKGKYFVGDALRQLVGTDANTAEMVGVFNKLTAPRDSHVGLLRKVREVAPEQLRAVGRAWLEHQLDQATVDGGFQKADTLLSAWHKIGPETRGILFGTDVAKELDQFFLVASRINKSPNPSGSALVGSTAAGAVGMLANPLLAAKAIAGNYGLSKLLYSARGVKLLTKGMQMELRPGGASGAQRQAFALDLARAAKALGVTPSAEDQR